LADNKLLFLLRRISFLLTTTTHITMFNNKIRVMIPNYRAVVQNSKSFTVYCVEVVCDGKVTTIEHRYSKFYELYRKFSKMVEGKLAFPPKRLLNNKEEKLIEARQRGLEMYLQNLLLNFHEDDIPARLLEFLGIPDYYQQQYEIENNNNNDDMDSCDGDFNAYTPGMPSVQQMISFSKDAFLVPTLQELEAENTLQDIIKIGCLEGIYG